MSEQPIPYDADAADVLPPLDLAALTFGDVPTDDEFSAPQHEASREPRRPLFGRGRDAHEEPPKRGRTRTTTRPTRTARKVPTSKPGQFVEPLSQVYVGIGAMLLPFDATCGAAIVESGPRCAETLDKLAQQNDAVRRALFALTQTSAITAVVVAHAPIMIAVARHHVPAYQRVEADMMTRAAEMFANNGQQPQDDEQNGSQDA